MKALEVIINNQKILAGVIDAELQGSGDIVVRGTTDILGVSVDGSGDFEGYSLTANKVDARVRGSGDISVYSKESLKADAGGSGDIVYKGNPETLDIKTSGAGDVNKY